MLLTIRFTFPLSPRRGGLKGGNTMATYLQLFDLAASQEMKKRLAWAILLAAQAIKAEDPVTDNHAARLSWANQSGETLNTAFAMAEKTINELLKNATIQTNAEASTDGDIQFVVNSFVSDPATLKKYISG